MVLGFRRGGFVGMRLLRRCSVLGVRRLVGGRGLLGRFGRLCTGEGDVSGLLEIIWGVGLGVEVGVG